jgi:hypothetical protein
LTGRAWERAAEPADAPARQPAVRSQAVPVGAPGEVLQLCGLVGNAAVTALLGQGQPATLTVQRQHVRMQNGIWVGAGGGGSADDNVRESVLTVLDRLHETWSVTNAEYGPAAAAIAAVSPGQQVPAAALAAVVVGLGRNEQPVLAGPVAANLLDTPFTGGVGRGQPNAKADVLALLDGLLAYGQISATDHARERAAANAAVGPGVPDAVLAATYVALSRFKVANVAGVVRQDVGGARPPAAASAARVSSILNPGSGVSHGVYVPPPPMTGAGPGGPFETAMLAALRTDVHTWAVSYKARKAHGPTMPVASVQDGVRAAQEELERHFGPYVTSASHAPGDRYHPGTYNAAAMVAPASSRGITPGHRLGWTGYWMTLSSGSAPQSILNTYHPDAAEQARVRDLFANNPANHPDIDDAIHGWPAEAGSGTIFLDEYRQFANTTEERRVRWDIFTTAVHEILHVLAHPNYRAASTALGSTAQKYLRCS